MCVCVNAVRMWIKRTSIWFHFKQSHSTATFLFIMKEYSYIHVAQRLAIHIRARRKARDLTFNDLRRKVLATKRNRDGIVLHKQQFNRLNENKANRREYEQPAHTHIQILFCIWHTSLKWRHIHYHTAKQYMSSFFQLCCHQNFLSTFHSAKWDAMELIVFLYPDAVQFEKLSPLICCAVNFVIFFINLLSSFVENERCRLACAACVHINCCISVFNTIYLYRHKTATATPTTTFFGGSHNANNTFGWFIFVCQTKCMLLALFMSLALKG